MSKLTDPKVLLLLLVSLLVAVWFWRSGSEQSLTPTLEPQDPNTPDAFIINGHYRVFRDNGQLSSVMTSENAIHYPKDNTGHMKEPRIELMQEDGRPWHIESREGLIELNLDTVTLQNDVVISSLDRHQQPVKVTTDWLQLNNKTRFITTDRAVAIKSQYTDTTAVGMDAYVDAKRLILKSQVRGEYEPIAP